MPMLLKAILLGLIQGLTEFLPVSSSGHLVIFQDLFGFHENSLLFDVFLHVGTLVPVVIVFRNEIRTLLTTRRTWPALLVAGTVPIALVGLLLHKQIETTFETVRWVGPLLLVNAGVLLAGGPLAGLHQRKRAPGWRHALAVGVAQAAAIMPGISRSGTTISTGMATGLDREDAARFSFLLAIPAIVLALVYKLSILPARGAAVGPAMWGAIAVGTLVSMLVGYAALRVLLAVVRRRRLGRFGWYCLAVGAASLVYHLVH
jgi:undecaprenyl-diphosphatase